MTEQEKINVNIENRLTGLETKFELFMQEAHQQREDIRRLHERQDAMQAKHDAEMHEMNERFYGRIDALSKQIHDTWKQTMIGVGGMIIGLGAIIATVGGIIFAALK